MKFKENDLVYVFQIFPNIHNEISNIAHVDKRVVGFEGYIYRYPTAQDYVPKGYVLVVPRNTNSKSRESTCIFFHENELRLKSDLTKDFNEAQRLLNWVENGRGT